MTDRPILVTAVFPWRSDAETQIAAPDRTDLSVHRLPDEATRVRMKACGESPSQMPREGVKTPLTNSRITPHET